MDKNIGENIKQARVKAGYTQEKLAEKIDVSLSVISRLETGRTMVSVAKLQKIARILETSVGSFFELPSPDNPEYPQGAETALAESAPHISERPENPNKSSNKSHTESRPEPNIDWELYTLIQQLPDKGKIFFKNALRCYLETF